MDTNKSKYTKKDLRDVRKELDPNLSPKQARKENREWRKKISRRTRRLEKSELQKIIKNDELDNAQDFWRK